MANSFTSLGTSIPVTGPYIGFPGNISRQPSAGGPIIRARQLLSTTTSNLNFGDVAVLIKDATGGTWQPLKDFIGAAVANVAKVGASVASAGANLAVAVRQVKTMLTYPAGQAPGLAQVGYYAPGEIAECLEMGSIIVPITRAGSINADDPVYARLVANASYASSPVGGLEGSSDTVSTTGTASSGSTALTVASGTGIAVGQLVAGAGVAAGTYVAAVSGTSVTLSANTTAALSTTPVVFANSVVVPDFVFTTGYTDGSGVAEITILRRRGA